VSITSARTLDTGLKSQICARLRRRGNRFTHHVMRCDAINPPWWCA
jgi:hypothetical protein